MFLGSPWGWSPWWGGYNRYGFGYNNWGWGIGRGSWGWGDWWCPWGYAPLAYRTGYWNYYNPYCYEPLVLGTTVINYSEPIILSSNSVAPEADTEDSPAMVQFEAARAAFARGDYDSALQSTHRALEYLPTDAALNEFLALVHFARGNYRDSAGVIHSVLAAGPGWNWDTMIELYGGDVNTYTRHLRAAEAYRKANPQAAEARFLLAYHYTTTGHKDAATKQLREVLALEPNDTVAAQLLEGLTGERLNNTPSPGPALLDPATATASSESFPEPPPLPTSIEHQVLKPGARPVAEEFVGSWSAAREDGGEFSLNLTAENRFDWKFTRNDQTSELTGNYSLKDDLLVLEPEEGGAMIGRVEMTGDKQFRFRLIGVPEEDPGLTFRQ